MASRLVSRKFCIPSRGLSAAPAQAHASGPSLTKQDIKSTKLSNGLTVVSIDELNPISTVSVAVKAGSRHESYDNRGVAHAVRAACGLSSSKNTPFGIVRNIQQAGGNISCTQNREILLYSSQLIRDKTEEDVMNVFINAVTSPNFKPWEISDLGFGKMKLDLELRSHAVLAQELLHKAAFREGLGNSIFAPENTLGKHSHDMMKKFFETQFVTQNSALIGVGINHEVLLKAAESISLKSAAGAPVASSKYFGGEMRHEVLSGEAHISIGVALPGLKGKELMAAALLQRILGIGPRVKWGFGAGLLAKVNKDEISSLSAILYPYSDSTVFGVYVATANPEEAGNLVKSAVGVLKSPSFTQAHVTAAKKNVLADISEELLSSEGMTHHLATGTLVSGEVTSLKEVAALIESVTVSDVKALQKQISSVKLSMGAVGNLKTVPYLDSL